MREIARTTSPVALPEPRTPIAIRVATMADLPFLDSLQKKYNKALGYFPTKQFEGYIATSGVLVAVGARPASRCGAAAGDSTLRVDHDAGVASTEERFGYIISRDRYLKRDELGVVYQLCVVPGDQRKLIGASLVKAVFERAAYGCRLFCCWCAQDLHANYFWESLGFVPIAFRGGSGKKKRVHIFWQKRIDDQSQIANRQSAIPWWYPFKTDQGAMRADRIVFPIPPGVHWRDIRPPHVQAVALPVRGEQRMLSAETKQKPAVSSPAAPAPAHRSRGVVTRQSALRFGPPVAPVAEPVPSAPAKAEQSRRRTKPPEKIDPQFIAAARELRDRYLERVNESATMLMATGKYDLGRALPAPNARTVAPLPAPIPPMIHSLPSLPAAA